MASKAQNKQIDRQQERAAAAAELQQKILGVMQDELETALLDDGVAAIKDDGDSTETQASALEAHDEKAMEASKFPGFSSFDEMINYLTGSGQADLAEQLLKQKAESDRWAAHEEAIEADRVEMTAEVVEPGSEEDPFRPDTPYFYVYTPEDVRDMASAALEGKAEAWEEEARVESLRGAGSPAHIATLKWGASQLRDVAAAIRSLGHGEWREPVAPVEEIVVS